MPLFLNLAATLSISVAAFFSGNDFGSQSSFDTQQESSVQTSVDAPNTEVVEVTKAQPRKSTITKEVMSEIRPEEEIRDEESFDFSALGHLSSLFEEEGAVIENEVAVTIAPLVSFASHTRTL